MKDIIEPNAHAAQYPKPNKYEVSSCDPLKRGTDRLNAGFSAQILQLDSFFTTLSLRLFLIKDSELKATAFLFFVICAAMISTNYNT